MKIITLFATVAIPIIMFILFLKDRYFNKKRREEKNDILEKAYKEICEEIPYIEGIANNAYSEQNLNSKTISKYPYDDILKTAKELLTINTYIFLSKKIISIIERKTRENIRENAKELFKYSKKLKEKLKTKKEMPIVIKAVIIGAIITGMFALILKFIPDKKTIQTTGNNSPAIVNDELVVGDKVEGDKIIMSYFEDYNKNNIEKNKKIAKIHINRLLNDYGLNIENLRKEYYKESSRISSDMAARNIVRSGLNIKAQKDHAIETKNKINEVLAKLTRDIEDILLESYDNYILKEVEELKKEYDTYNSLQEKTNDLYEKMVDNVRSWEVKINGSVSTTKDFTLK